MKNKILALLATIGLASSVTAVEINENISINGFIDGSWSSTDVTGQTRNNQDLGLDEVELNILVNAGNVSGELHIDDNGDMSSLDLEQVHFTYSFENGLSAQIGAFGSALGFEREDPAGLYTFSRAYGAVTAAGNTDIYNIGNIDAQEYVGEGVRLSYSTDTVSISVAAINGVGDLEENDATNPNGFGDLEDNLDFEVAIAFTGIENLAVGAGIVSVNGVSRPGAPSVDPSIYNINAAYTLDKLLIAGEYSKFDQDTDDRPDLAAWMLLADYDINDKIGIAVRYSEYEKDANTESDRFTIAPNYAITDSLGAILEYTSDDDNAGSDSDTLALELTYTF
jgi:hypothetical protein